MNRIADFLMHEKGLRFLRMDVTILFKPRKLTFFFQIRHIIYLLFFSFFSIKISIKEFLLALPFVFAWGTVSSRVYTVYTYFDLACLVSGYMAD